MPADSPEAQGAAPGPPAPGQADASPRRKAGKALSEPASDVFATWKDPPPVPPADLSSKVWADDVPSSPEGAAGARSSGPPRSGEPVATIEPETEQPVALPPGEEPAPEGAPADPAVALSVLPARIEDVVRRRIDEAVGAAARTVAAALAPALSRLPASIEENLRATVRAEVATFAGEQERVAGELRQAIANLERTVEELKPREEQPGPATAARMEEGFFQLRQLVEDVGPEVGKPLGELRDAVLAQLAADQQVRDVLASMSERLAALEERGILAIEEPLRELRREVAHDLGALAARVEAGLAEVAGRPASDPEDIREAVVGSVEKMLAERLDAVRQEVAHEVSSEIAAAASMARTAVGEARFARGQLAQAVKAMGEVVTAADEPAE